MVGGGMFARAMAATSQSAIGPATINRQWLLASHAEDKISVANFAYREAPLGDAANLKAGDVIVQVGNTRVNTAQVASKTINDYGARGPVYLIFERAHRLLQSPSFSLR